MYKEGSRYIGIVPIDGNREIIFEEDLEELRKGVDTIVEYLKGSYPDVDFEKEIAMFEIKPIEREK